MDNQKAYDAALAYAAARGAGDGANAAGWYVQDTIGGRVSGDPTKAARYILRGIDDGDSAVTDGFPFADLSGQWADSLTGPQLVNDAWASAGVNSIDDPNIDPAFLGYLRCLRNGILGCRRNGHRIGR
jgi:hypothetical protein